METIREISPPAEGEENRVARFVRGFYVTKSETREREREESWIRVTRRESRCVVRAKWFTRVLLSAPGVQRSYLRFYPAASVSPLRGLARGTRGEVEGERVKDFIFQPRKKGWRERREPRFHKSRLAHLFP